MNPVPSHTLFSIVIPVWNRASVLTRTLDSILAQDYRPLQLILVDNASTDDSAALMHSWAQAHSAPEMEVTILSEPRAGAAIARNRGLREVRGEYMLFFDSDDTLLPGAVSRYMQGFLSPSAPDIVLSPAMHLSSDGRWHSEAIRHGDALISHLHHCTLRTQGYAARTQLFTDVGEWDENLRIWDDWELGVRLLLHSPTLLQLTEPSCHIYTSAESLSGEHYSEREPLYEDAISAVERALISGDRADSHLMADMVSRYRRMLLAAHFAAEGQKDMATRWRHKALQGASLTHRWLLRGAYAYIKRGGRGYDRLITALYR